MLQRDAGNRRLITLLQRVTEASVEVDGSVIGAIGPGLLVPAGVRAEDDEASVKAAVERLLNYRVFADADGKMNLSLRDVEGGLLLVPQFTLAADTRKGRRPSFSSAASPQRGQQLFELALDHARAVHQPVAGGRFGADMRVQLVNDGPVTFILD